MKNELTADNKIIVYTHLLIMAIGLTVIFVFTKPVLLPLVFSIFFYSILSPMVDWIETKFKAPRWVGITIAFSLAIISFGSLLLMGFISIENFTKEADVYRHKIIDAVQVLSELPETFGIELNRDLVVEKVKSLPVFTVLTKITTGLTSLIANSILILIFLLFLMVGERNKNKSNKFVKEILSKISHYLIVKFLLSLSTGILVGLALLIFKVDLAFLFGLLAFLLNFIPNVGSLIATVLPLPLVFLEYGFGWQFFGVLFSTLFVQLIIGNFIEPRWMGETMDLHPIVILMFLMFWGLVWGLPGMFLAVPITALIKIILSRINATRQLAEWMGGRISS